MSARLDEAARDVLRDAGISQAAYARWQGYAYGRWGGDACGCPDDRCSGFHTRRRPGHRLGRGPHPTRGQRSPLAALPSPLPGRNTRL
jgi:hypothetical protein